MNKKKTIAAMICIAALTCMNVSKPTYIKKTITPSFNASYANVKSLAADSNDSSYDVPNKDTSFKTYMSYRAITDTSSTQYELQQEAWTDENGFRRIKDDYLVAMGTYYAEECGIRFKVTLEDGNEITVMIGDIKADIHTNSTNQYTPVYDSNGIFISANVLEFIVDTDVLPKRVKRLGSANCIEELHGNIVAIEKICKE